MKEHLRTLMVTGQMKGKKGKKKKTYEPNNSHQTPLIQFSPINLSFPLNEVGLLGPKA